MEILKVQNLCKTYGKGEARVDALKNVSFALEKGEFAAVVGESGSGKSTLLNCIGALDAPSSGSVTMEGHNLHTMKEEERTVFRRRNIGFIFQSFQLVSELTVEQNIIFPILLDYRKPNEQDVKEILDMLGLTERRNHLPHQLSGGQQQRVAIGRALITRPKLILADEPTGNLDSKNSQDVMDLLTQAARHYQQTILMITHNNNLTASVDRVLRVTDGVLTDLGGNANDLQPVRRAANTTYMKVDTSLGIHHAKSSKKNFVLMVGSFSLSIILFLSFSVTIDFMKHTLTPLHPWTADLSIISPDQTCSVKNGLIEELSGNPAVDKVYGRMFAYNVPVVVNGETKTVDLITYEEKQFDWAKNYKLSGSLETAQNQTGTALVVFEAQNTIQVGDTVTLNMGGKSSNIEIVGMVSDCPFNNRADVGKLICSEETFRQMTGESDYTIIDIQLAQVATENDVSAIRKMAGGTYTFSDDRMSNSNTRGTYYCFGLFVYGFLVLIALITIFNVINSIAMSVAARMNQYGAFRAIGLSNRQLVRMVVAEASTYAVTGSICGGILGLLCNKILFDKLVGFNWGDPWNIPVAELAVIIAVVVIAVILAIRGPIKKIRDMSIVDTISAQ